MASLLRIKRSATSGNPSALGQGELAYSYLADNGSNGGDRLYIGTGSEIAGNAVNHEIIGGKYFTAKLDHALGTLTPNSAILVDANSKIDILNVDNLTLNGNTISTTDTNGNLIVSPHGSGVVSVAGSKISHLLTPTADSDATTKAYVDGKFAAVDVVFSLAGDGGTDTFNAGTGTLTFDGGTGLTSAVTDDQVSYALDNTAVTAGSYGSASAIPTFTVDAQGRLTAAGTASISTELTVNGAPISLADSALSFAASGNGIAMGFNHATNTVTYTTSDATTSGKGVAQFLDSDFAVASGIVSLKGNVLSHVTTDTGAMTLPNHSISILGGEGMNVTHADQSIAITGEDATTTNKGIASFASADFDVSSGAVSLKAGSVANGDLANDGITIGDTDTSLGGTVTDLTGLTGATIDTIRINGNTISTNGSTNELILDPLGGDSVTGKVVILGDLQVNGTQTIINSVNMSVNDKTLTLADSAADAAAANGAGIVIAGASANLVYAASGDKWTANKTFDAPEIMRNGVALDEYIEDIMGASIAVGEGLDFAYNDTAGTHTFTAEIATITNKGVASYDSDVFTVTSGAVTVTSLDGGTY